MLTVRISLTLTLCIHSHHPSRQFFQTASSVCTELILISSGWSANTGRSVCRGSFFPLVLFVLLGWFLRLEVSGSTAVVSWGIASRICPKLLVAFFCSSHLAYSLCILLASMWCIHAVVSTHPQLERNSCFFVINSEMQISFLHSYLNRSITIIIDYS